MMIKLTVFLIFSSLISINAGIFECNTNNDCVFECEDNACICPLKQVHNLQGTECLELAVFSEGEHCKEDRQCGLLGGSYKCESGNCVCAKGWVYFRGKCIKRLQTGDLCNKDEDCFDGYQNAKVCKDKKCTCNIGYYDRQGFDCRKLKNLGEDCSIDLDCKNATCLGGYCWRNNNDNLRNTIPDSRRNNLRNAILDDFDIIYKHSRSFNLEFAEDCDNSDSCTEKYTYCSPIFGKCLCRKGYFRFGGTKCKPELGSHCDRGMCEENGRFCDEGICLCKDGYFDLPGNQECRLDAIAPEFNCNDDDRCAIFGTHYQCNYVSSDRKQCVCVKGYKLNENYLCEPCGSA